MTTRHIPILALACCALIAAAGCKEKESGNTGGVQPGSVERPEMVSRGIGVKFSVPAGQAAVFEVVTRREGMTVPLPTLAAYVTAPLSEAVTGTFRFYPESERTGPDVRRHVWRIEVVSGAGNGSVGGLSLPDALEAAVGRLIVLLELEPNSERIHWQRSDDSQLPADGLVGLRITTVAHTLKTGGSGVGHTAWKNPSTKTKP